MTNLEIWNEAFGAHNSITAESRDSNLLSEKGIQYHVTRGDRCFLEVTLNHPRTMRWKRLSYDEQVVHLVNLWYRIVTYGTKVVKEHYVIEKCQDGTPHLHGMMQMVVSDPHLPLGVVCDIVHRALNHVPQRYSHFRSNYICERYDRYQSPYVCVQYVHNEDRDGVAIWETYMKKTH